MNYLVIGDDVYIREKETLKIKEKFLSTAETGLNYSVYTPQDIESAMDSLRTMPFLSKKRVVAVKEVEHLSPENAAIITNYLENPSETGILVLSADNSLREKKFYKKISSLSEIVKSDKPAESVMKRWIFSFFQKQQTEISPEAVNLIVELKGTDTAGIKSELEKLVCFANGEKIEVRNVEKLVGRSTQEMIFKLVDAVNARDAKWAFRILNDLYDQKKKPPEIIGYLSWYTKMMQKTLLLSHKGIALNGIAAELGYSPGYARRLLEQAKKYSADKIKRWVSSLFETDKEIKTGRKKPEIAIEMLMAYLLKA